MIQYVLKRGQKYLSDSVNNVFGAYSPDGGIRYGTEEQAINKAIKVGDCKVKPSARCVRTGMWVEFQ